MSLAIRKAERGDVAALAVTMRQQDVDEVELVGMTPASALAYGLAKSKQCWTAFYKGRVVCMFGVSQKAKVGGHTAPVGWLLTSDVVEDCPLAFWKACRAILPALVRKYGKLVNLIDARNEQAVRWAKRLGFTVMDPVMYGNPPMPCHPFVVTKEALECARQQ